MYLQYKIAHRFQVGRVLAYSYECRNISRITENMHKPCAINSLGRVAAHITRQQLTFCLHRNEWRMLSYPMFAHDAVFCMLPMMMMMMCIGDMHATLCTGTHNATSDSQNIKSE